MENDWALELANRICRSQLLVFVLTALSVAVPDAIACSSLPRTPEEVFRNSVAVFSGTVTSAEAIEFNYASKEDAEKFNGLFAIKVRWKIDEIYKGQNLVGKSAFTTNLCGVPVLVGFPYIFVVSKLDQPKKSDPLYGLHGLLSEEVIGILDSASMKGYYLQSDEANYNELKLAFKKLSKDR